LNPVVLKTAILGHKENKKFLLVPKKESIKVKNISKMKNLNSWREILNGN
jgi:hypothetical protein